MNTFFISYLFPSSVALAGMYLFYRMVLSKESSFQINRLYLVGALVFACLLPFIKISSSFAENIQYGSLHWATQVTGIAGEISELTEIGNPIAEPIQLKKETYSFWNIIWVVYGFVCLVLLIRLWVGIAHIIILRIQFRESVEGRVVYMQNKMPHFSFLGLIFINMNLIKSEDELDKIIIHEQTHCKQIHAIDLLLMEFVCMVQWFNPIVWLYKHTLKEVHEYLADEAVIRKGVDPFAYSDIIFNQTAGFSLKSLDNTFHYSPIKKRINMIMNKKQSKNHGLKLLGVLPLVAFLLFFFACKTNSKSQNSNSYFQEDEKQDPKAPLFPGGKEAMNAFIEKNKVYPEKSKAEGSYGTILMRCYIDRKGNIQVSSTHNESNSEELEQEATRIIKLMPKWEWNIPVDSIPRAYMVDIPIDFDLPESERASPPTYGKGNTDQNIRDYLLANVDMKKVTDQILQCGGATFMLFITEKGEVKNVGRMYNRYAGNSKEDEIVTEALMKLQFNPANKKGKPLKGIYNFDYGTFVNELMDKYDKEKRENEQD